MAGLLQVGFLLALASALRSAQGRLVESPAVARLRSGLRTHEDRRVPAMSMGRLWSEEELPTRVARGSVPSLSRAQSTARSRRRRAPGIQPSAYITQFFNDWNSNLEMQWTGSDKANSSVMVIRTSSRYGTSNIYFSYDYARSFHVGNQFRLPSGARVSISHFESSKANGKRYIFVDQLHRFVFTSRDDCRTFQRFAFAFPMAFISSHPSDPNIIIALDYQRKVWISHDWAQTWKLLVSGVQAFQWGQPGVGDDTANTLYVQQAGAVGISRSHDFFVTSHIFESYAVGMVFHGRYILALRAGQPSTVIVSRDRGKFAAATFTAFVDGADTTFHEYFVVDATDSQAFVVAFNEVSSNSALYISDLSGTSFTLSLDNFAYNRHTGSKSAWIGANTQPFYQPVEWHRVAALDSVFIAARRVGAVVTSVVTYDAGGLWEPVRSDSATADGQELPCPEGDVCTMHLTHKTASALSRSFFLTSSRAPGILMAQGDYGKAYKTASVLYTSIDAGHNWQPSLKGQFWMDMGDHGGVMAAIEYPRSGVLTNTLRYSLDYGSSWKTYKFFKTPLHVYGLLSEPGHHSTVFNIVGGNSRLFSFTVVSVDFRDVLGRPCNTSTEYEVWHPVDSLLSLESLDDDADHYGSSFGCLLGRREHFLRRLQFTVCLAGVQYKPQHWTNICNCSREDYECAPGYESSVSDPSCHPAASAPIYIAQLRAALVCRNDTLTFPSGYRRIAGDVCRPDSASARYEAKRLACKSAPTSAGPIVLQLLSQGKLLPVRKPITVAVGLAVELRVQLPADVGQKSNVTILWHFGDTAGSDGRVYSGQQAKHTYSNPGQYHITAVAVLDHFVRRASAQINVAERLPVNFAISVRASTIGHYVQLHEELLFTVEFPDNNVVLAGITYEWDVCGQKMNTRTPFLQLVPKATAEVCPVKLRLSNALYLSSQPAVYSLRLPSYSSNQVRVTDLGIPNTLLVSWKSLGDKQPDAFKITTPGVEVIAPGNASKWLLTGLPEGRRSVRVISIFNDVLVNSNPVWAAVSAAVEEVGTPRNVSVTQPASGQDLVSWDPVPFALKYQIFLISHECLSFGVELQASECSVSPSSRCQYTWNHADKEGFYFYRVRALDADNSPGELSYIVGKGIPAVPVPQTAPSNLKFVSLRSSGPQVGRALLTWDFPEQFSAFVVNVSSSSGSVPLLYVRTNNLSLVLNDLCHNCRYLVRVGAVNSGSKTGPYAEIVAFHEFLNDQAPQNVTVATVSTNQVRAQWHAPVKSLFWTSEYAVQVAGPYSDPSAPHFNEVPAESSFSTRCRVPASSLFLGCDLGDLNSSVVYWLVVRVLHTGSSVYQGVPSAAHRFITSAYGAAITKTFSVRPLGNNASTSMWTTVTPTLGAVGTGRCYLSVFGQTIVSQSQYIAAGKPPPHFLLWPSTLYEFRVLWDNGVENSVRYRTQPAEEGSFVMLFKVASDSLYSETATAITSSPAATAQDRVLSALVSAVGQSTVQSWVIGMFMHAPPIQGPTFSGSVEGPTAGGLHLRLVLGEQTPEEVLRSLAVFAPVLNATDSGNTTSSDGHSAKQSVSWLSALQQYSDALDKYDTEKLASNNVSTATSISGSNLALLVAVAGLGILAATTLVYFISRTISLYRERQMRLRHRSILHSASSGRSNTGQRRVRFLDDYHSVPNSTSHNSSAVDASLVAPGNGDDDFCGLTNGRGRGSVESHDSPAIFHLSGTVGEGDDELLSDI